MEPLVNPFFPLQTFQPHENERMNFEQLTNIFAAHERSEQRFLESYQDVVNQNENPLVRFLLRMIMADEEKHHAVVQSISESLKSDLTGLLAGKGLPKFGRISDKDKEALLALTAEFIETEKDGIEEYRALLEPTKNHYGGLLALLIETIIHDSEKHLMILRFIDNKLREN
jgi:rubrerythrin